MKKILCITVSLLIAITMASCNDDSKNKIPEEETGNNEQEGEENGNTGEYTANDILIVYFSRAGYNYPNDYLTVGYTAVMGGYIKDYTGGTIYEIIPAIPYPEDYEETKTVSQRETANNERPAIKNPLENLDSYKIVFVGSPIWYSAPPMIMRTFYETYDLSNKIIIPFGTHEGSGIGSCTTLVREYFPDAQILESFGVSGRSVKDSRSEVENWLEKIEIPKNQ
jgi:flavodoxin